MINDNPRAAGDPFHTIFYRLRDENGNLVAGATNDQCPTDGTEVVFGTVASGFSVGTDNIQLIDARVRSVEYCRYLQIGRAHV